MTGPVNLDEALKCQMALAGFDGATALRFSVLGSPRCVAPDVGAELTAIVGEALLNAARHARAKSVEVLVDYRRDGLTIDVADDGVGIPVSPSASAAPAPAPAGHYGILGMRERAAKLGAAFSVERRDGGGTLVRIATTRGSAMTRLLRLFGSDQKCKRVAHDR
jgi:signal transduction histidine kinase